MIGDSSTGWVLLIDHSVDDGCDSSAGCVLLIGYSVDDV